MRKTSIGIGLIGIGIIGGAVARVLRDRADRLSAQVGVPVELRRVKIADIDLTRPIIAEFPRELFTTDEVDFWATPGIDIVVEAIGGEFPAFNYLEKALRSGKHVVSSNKEVIAKHAAELLDLSRKNNVGLRFEAAVGGGIPLLQPFQYDLSANEIKGIFAIINGTTNYILTRMAREGIEFSEALKQAQSLGYAERNPANDIEGFDSVYKLSIMSMLAFQTEVKPDDIYREGITKLEARDFKYAEELGFVIKLLAIAKESEGEIELRVHPVFLPRDYFLAKVDGVFNAVLTTGDLVGDVIFSGQGAGPAPTSSAVVADVLASAQEAASGVGNRMRWRLDGGKRLRPMADITTRYYFRLNVADKPGVLAHIAGIFGDNNISISSVIQKEVDETTESAEVVIMTHPARESAVRRAVEALDRLDTIKAVNNFIRVGI
ncbi:homoserine dehydrogenase [Dehalogenimonas alkenigignens]|uniref:Homoserine dehydrogenase n=1 Tax=Dehalogenimonas alkenigignens TaxID=1217799 RepID=A0A0W0GIL6_9CHLR|nr:homoserine dehydrogenase [Dehalogenimonas alkenigignens]KTB48389.1 homoserine dehydrogenase [Dehalogenimonas alkenigignens]PVV85150.1 homoserine dehydrogenase [Dehalogenimonas alkenigignens]